MAWYHVGSEEKISLAKILPCYNFSYMHSLTSRHKIVFIAGNRFYYSETLGE